MLSWNWSHAGCRASTRLVGQRLAFLEALLIATSALTCIAPALTGSAQAAPGTQPEQRRYAALSAGVDAELQHIAQQNTARAINLPAQPLSSALRQFSELTGVQVAYNTPDLAGVNVEGLSGTFTPGQALRMLLKDTHASYSFTSADTVVIRVAQAATVATDATLATITVEEGGETEVESNGEETAWGPVDGYVATRSAAGTKNDTPIIETPQSVSVVTRDQMQARAVQSVNEALQYTPGVYTDLSGKDPRFEQIKIRGFNAQGLGSYRDGLRQLGNPNNFAHFRTETYGLERIDVLRGPSSVLYGQNAPGGLYDMISKRPTEGTLREFVGTIGSDEQFQGAFDLGGAVDEEGKLLFRLTGLARDADAPIAHFSDFVEDDRLFIAPALTWQPTADTKLTILTDYQHDVTGHAFPINQRPSLLSGDVIALPLFAGDPNFHEFDQEQFRLGYLFEHRFNDRFMIRQNLRYGEVDLDYRYVAAQPTLTGASAAPRFAFLVNDNTETFAVDNQLHAKLSTGPFRHTILAGLDYQDFAEDFSAFRGPAPALDLNNPAYGQNIATPTMLTQTVDQKLNQLGLYVQDQTKWQNWVLTLGGRYDWAEAETHSTFLGAPSNQATKDEAFTGRAGLNYVFDFGLAPYVSFSESFLPTAGTDFFGNPFEPTTGQQYEAGVKYEVGSALRATLAAFDITQQNVLTADPNPNHTGFNVQTGEIRSRGFEAEVVASLADGLDVITSYTYQDVEVTEDTNPAVVGKVPTLVPEHLASIFADYTFPSGPLAGFGFGAGVRYIGSTYKDNINTAKNDAYVAVDGAIHYSWDDVRVALNVSNLFDHEQGVCSTAGCQWISPRIVTGTLRMRW